jgi:hypothetical protein
MRAGDALKIELLRLVARATYDDEEIDLFEHEGWFYRPYTEDEIARHPDRERIWATIDALRAGTLQTVRDALIEDIGDLFREDREDAA